MELEVMEWVEVWEAWRGCTKIFFRIRPMSTSLDEKKGYIFITLVALFWGMFPIVMNKGVAYISPLFFASTSLFTAGLVMLIVSIAHGNFRKIFSRQSLWYGSIVGLCIATFPNALMFIGTKLTSGINTSALMLSEIIFTLLILPFFGEKPAFNKTIGGVLVFIGSGIILFKGGQLNLGDVLVFMSTLTLPIGNHFAKKAIVIMPIENLMLLRYFIGGVILMVISFYFENRSQMIPSVLNYWPYVAINGVLLFGIVNSIWYKALKLLEVSRAVFVMMTFPIFSLIFLVVFFKESPQLYQIFGVFVILVGAYFTTRKDAECLRPA